jgi:NADPH:quinone reductase-like Zn-dependent oxidoreductase
MCMTRLTKQDMTVFRELMESGKVKPVIDRTFKLTEVQDAVRYLDTGHARGKVVITIE